MYDRILLFTFAHIYMSGDPMVSWLVTKSKELHSLGVDVQFLSALMGVNQAVFHEKPMHLCSVRPTEQQFSNSFASMKLSLLNIYIWRYMTVVTRSYYYRFRYGCGFEVHLPRHHPAHRNVENCKPIYSVMQIQVNKPDFVDVLTSLSSVSLLTSV